MTTSYCRHSPFLSRTGNVLHAFVNQLLHSYPLQEKNIPLHTVPNSIGICRQQTKFATFTLSLQRGKYVISFYFPLFKQSGINYPPTSSVPLSFKKGASFLMLPLINFRMLAPLQEENILLHTVPNLIGICRQQTKFATFTLSPERETFCMLSFVPIYKN